MRSGKGASWSSIVGIPSFNPVMLKEVRYPVRLDDKIFMTLVELFVACPDYWAKLNKNLLEQNEVSSSWLLFCTLECFVHEKN